jgi:hypothetical protein
MGFMNYELQIMNYDLMLRSNQRNISPILCNYKAQCNDLLKIDLTKPPKKTASEQE